MRPVVALQKTELQKQSTVFRVVPSVCVQLVSEQLVSSFEAMVEGQSLHEDAAAKGDTKGLDMKLPIGQQP